MKMKFIRLILRTKRADYEIPFSDSITYFYGKIGAGKSTIPRLINFCLGGDLEETPALQNEFVSVGLELIIGDNQVKLERQRGANSIVAMWHKLPTGEPLAMQVPIQTQRGKYIIPGTKVENISDLIFHLAGLEPPYVLRSKYREESEIVRLSFRDLMWFCYLDQDHIDSSFFYLYGEDPFKRNKSQDAIRFIFGFHFEEVTKLELEYNQLKSEKSGLMSSIAQLQSFLEENGIKGVDDIKKQIKNKQEELDNLNERISEIHQETFVQTHPIDELKNKSRTLAKHIDTIREKIDDIDYQISNQNRLKSEYITANMKIDRTKIARQVFRNVHFNTCPQCGQHVQENDSVSACSLCGQTPIEQSIESMNLMGPDLIEQIKEIDSSVEQLLLQKRQFEYSLKEMAEEKKTVDDRFTVLEKDYDSKYLSKAKELLQTKGIVEGHIRYLEQIMILPIKVEKLQQAADELTIKIEKVKRDLSEQSQVAIKKQTLLHDLEEIFLDTLKQVNFPGIRDDHVIQIPPRSYIPAMKSENTDDPTYADFANVGSGGKKTIFKACYALAIHRLAAKIKGPIPTFLIIDTPMKNISERENKDIFKSFYKFVFKLTKDEFKDRQIIIIDKEYYEEEGDYKVTRRHMTPDDSDNPPLIEYYRGP